MIFFIIAILKCHATVTEKNYNYEKILLIKIVSFAQSKPLEKTLMSCTNPDLTVNR